MARVEKYLDDAQLASYPRVSIIHGKGTGALRQGVQDYLKKHRGVKPSVTVTWARIPRRNSCRIKIENNETKGNHYMFMDKLAKVLLACCGVFLVIGVIYLVVLRSEKASIVAE